MMRQDPTDVQGEIHKSANVVGDFNTPLSVTGKSSRQTITIDTDNLDSIICPLALLDFYRLPHPTGAHNL